MFEAAGVERPHDSLTFSEFKALCDQLMAAEVAPYCFTYGQVGWYFEQMLANSGGLYFNENNGRTGRPTEVLFNQGQGVEVFTFLTGLILDGYAPNLGNTWTETDSTFQTQQAAIQIDSTSDVSLIQNSEFEVGTAYIPHSDSSERNGVVIGGAALWLIDSGDEAVNDAAWQFMKFMAEPEQQITWHIGSGYFPVRTDLADNPELKAFWDENPNFVTAIEQLGHHQHHPGRWLPQLRRAGWSRRPLPRHPPHHRPDLQPRAGRRPDARRKRWTKPPTKANEELANYNTFFE